MIKFPYTDFHEMNLDWILEKVKNLDTKTDEFAEEVQEVKETAEGLPKIITKRTAGQERVYFSSDDTDCLFLVVLARVSGGGASVQTVTRYNSISINGTLIAPSDVTGPIATWDSLQNHWYINGPATTYIVIIPLIGTATFE